MSTEYDGDSQRENPAVSYINSLDQSDRGFVPVVGAVIAAALLAGAGALIYNLYDSHNNRQIEEARARSGYQVIDANASGEPGYDKFLQVGDTKYFSHVDGRLLEDKRLENNVESSDN